MYHEQFCKIGLGDLSNDWNDGNCFGIQDENAD